MPQKTSESPDAVSDVAVSCDGDTLKVKLLRARPNPRDELSVDLTPTIPNKQYWTAFSVKSNHFKNKILLVQDIKGREETVVVYTVDGTVAYYRHRNNDTHPLTRLIIVKSRVAFIRLTRRGIRFIYACLIENRYDIPILEQYLVVGDDVRIRKQYPVFRHFPSKLKALPKILFTDYIYLKSLLGDEPPINEQFRVVLKIDDGELAKHSLTRGSKRIKAPKWYYAPITQTRRNGYSISIRRGAYGGLVLIRRLLEPVELGWSFRVYESRLVSFLLYHTAHFVRRLSPRKVNIYFEKNANQAEEGAIDIFRKARNISEAADNYFILNGTSKAYEKLQDEPGIIKNFTFKSYWLQYRANNVIATEVPQHANILRSGNKYLRMAPYTQKFVFLQHGVTYMKAQDKNSSFIKNREGEPDYMVVGSKKERDIVADMLTIEEERLLNVGLPIFDKIEYGHITQQSPDIATIMLTWKPYEEHMQDFSKSTYYQTVIALYDILKPLLGKENIRIVAHPKFAKLLASTDIADSLWKGTVSEVLRDTKLLITDYSSVCYNVFYQGGAVVFYQPDLERYEENNGDLIPHGSEYIGHRMFTGKDLRDTLKESIKNHQINLTSLRTKKHIQNYNSINEYHDGKNIDRLLDRLRQLGVL